MFGQNKLQKERNQKLLLELVSLPGNNICADCKARNPRWASHNLGIFICMHCASIHRKIGTHVTKVKSLTMDDWTKEQVETMKSIGNINSNAIYNPNELRHPPPPNLEDSERDSDLEQYIRSKYQYRKFLDKSALAASRLGPSKTASSAGKPPVSPSPERSKTPASTSKDQPVTATSAAASVAIPHRRPVVSLAHAALAKANTPECPLGLDKKPIPKPNPGPSTSTSSVWNDLSSLAAQGQDSSLPLQYQVANSAGPATLQASALTGTTSAMGYPVGATPTGMGINPFQAQMGFTPLQQQTMLSPFVPPLSAGPSVPTIFNNTQNQPWGQQWATASTQPTPVMIQSTTQTSFFQPQPQFSAQLQTTSAQNPLSHSPNQQLFSTPTTQTQFLIPSPSQQLRSHSSQMQTTIPNSTGLMLQNPMSGQVNMGLGANMTGMPGLGQPSFLGTTTMQMMQQQQMLQQQQQQQAMLGASQMQQMAASGTSAGRVGGAQMYSQGPQWGAM